MRILVSVLMSSLVMACSDGGSSGGQNNGSQRGDFPTANDIYQMRLGHQDVTNVQCREASAPGSANCTWSFNFRGQPSVAGPHCLVKGPNGWQLRSQRPC